MIAVENVVIAIISGIVAVMVAIIGRSRFNSVKESMRPGRAESKLIKTLNDTVNAQARQIESLRGTVDEQRIQLIVKDKQIEDLTKRVSNLESLVIDQATTIANLAKTRRPIRKKDGELESDE